MKKYSGWNALYLSFFYRDMYVDAVHGWKGLAYQYLFAIVVLTWVVAGIKAHAEWGQAMDYFQQKIVVQCPKLTLNKGHLSIDKPYPYYIRVSNVMSDEPQTVVRFDPPRTAVPDNAEPAMIVVRDDKVTVNLGPTQKKTVSLGELDLV